MPLPVSDFAKESLPRFHCTTLDTVELSLSDRELRDVESCLCLGVIFAVILFTLDFCFLLDTVNLKLIHFEEALFVLKFRSSLF